MNDFIQFEYTAKKTQIENCYRQLILYNYFSGKKNFLYPLFPLFCTPRTESTNVIIESTDVIIMIIQL